MANILILASYDLAAIPVIEWLAKGHDVRAVIGPHALNARMPSDTTELLEPLAEWAWVNDQFSSAETISVVDRWSERRPFDAVVCLDEFGVITAARLRRRLKVKVGQSVESARAYRRKDVMHSLLRGHVPLPEQEVVDNACDLLDAVERLGLPAMVKPTDSAGGVGNTELWTRGDAEKIVASYGMEFRPVIVQQFMSRTVFHVDGFVDLDGKLRYPSVSRYGYDASGSQESEEPPREQENRPWVYCSTMLDPRKPEYASLASLTQRVVDRLPSPEGAPVHAEFFLMPGGEFVFCEIASRAGGTGIPIAYERAVGLNLFELHARAQAGERDRVAQLLDSAHEFRPHGWYLWPVPDGVLLSVPGRCDVSGVVDYAVFGRVGQSYAGPRSSAESVQQFVVEGPDFVGTFARLGAWCQERTLFAPASAGCVSR